MMLARTLLCYCLGVWGEKLRETPPPNSSFFYRQRRDWAQSRKHSSQGSYPEPSVALEKGVPPLCTWSRGLESYLNLKGRASLCHLFAEVLISRIIPFESIYSICFKQNRNRHDFGRPEDPITIPWSPAPVQPRPGDFPATQRGRLVWVPCYAQIYESPQKPTKETEFHM